MAGLLPSAAADGPSAPSALSYTCRFPSGDQPVTVTVATELPAAGTAGRAVDPGTVTTSVALPDTEVAALAKQGTSLTARTSLEVALTDGGTAATAAWPGTQPTAAAVPSSGGMTVTTTGRAPTFEGDTPGRLTVSAGNLDLRLQLSPASAGAAPAEVDASCTADSGRVTTVGTVDLAGPTGTPTPLPSGRPPSIAPSAGAATAPPRARTAGPAPKSAGAGGRRAGTVVRPAAPECIGDHSNPLAMSAYITGLSNVNKLHGASLIPVSCAKILQGPSKLVFGGGYIVTILQHSTGSLYYKGEPETTPGRATFLSFGFMPTTATMTLRQIGPMTIDSVLHQVTFTYQQGETVIRVPLQLYVSNVTVNGKSLDVGPNCRTEGSVYSPDPDAPAGDGPHLVVTGHVESTSGVTVGYTLVNGGVVDGSVTIPPFTGCTAGGQDLDPLLTASISGHGNYVKQVQGGVCFAGNQGDPAASGCTPDYQPLIVPEPER
ncbi:DUF6801 domain-containing protein [Mangrovactinospora gilvigrisea]|uniref:DUF6801 domain-containing protein n=1 Tax=Mangrovactinospora gilvigrisea TaxID=1428644 RepID=UPI001114BC52|nr:DUF6801 domain-containing protein [Mangrovactinospora gilvigrisea]